MHRRSIFSSPGYGRTGGVYIHAIGAETLKRGEPLDLGWIPGFLLAFAAISVAVLRQRFAERFAVMGGAAGLLFFGPIFLEARLIFADITPGLFVLLVIASVLGWRRYRTRGLVNPVTNLPNLNALRANRDGRKRALVAARVLNYEEIVSALPPNSEPKLVEQIVSRLKVGAPERVLYQGDGGIFAWFEEPQQPVGNHLEALYALFRNPARVAGLSMDLTVAFGVEVGSGRSHREPPGQRARRRRRSRARRPQMEVSRSRDAGECVVEAVDAQPARRRDRSRAKCGSPISPSSTSRRAGSSAPKRLLAGPTPKRARSRRPNSSPQPSRTTASAS